MVSVFDGQLTRTWLYELGKRKHVINLYHDTITGTMTNIDQSPLVDTSVHGLVCGLMGGLVDGLVVNHWLFVCVLAKSILSLILA